MEKLWSGRFSQDLNKNVEKFTSSISFDKRLALYDIKGSMAHARSLLEAKIINKQEFKIIEKGLSEINEMIKAGKFKFEQADEDIHMAIEKSLIKKVGSPGRKLHTGRSRNDQVVTDLRMYCRDMVIEIIKLIIALQEQLVSLSEKNMSLIFPGYTHLQKAQPILFAHHLLAYIWMFKRDAIRLKNLYGTINVLPLGAGALAGTAYSINREKVAEELGFNEISENSIDAVSDRDFVLEFLAVLNILMIHQSRLCEELILWSTSEFNFVILDDSYTTGSSMMPQKKNPDVAELIRAKSGKVLGNLTALSVVLKGLPLSYNRDLQEDKESLFESVDIIVQSLICLGGLIQTIKINKDAMKSSVLKSYALATDVADYLVVKGLPFRDAHKVVGKLVAYLVENNLYLHQIKLDEYKKFSQLFEADIFDVLDPKAAVEKRKITGGTSYESVEMQIFKIKEWLVDVESWISKK